MARRIIVAEDDDDMRDFLGAVLSGAGFAVTGVEDGAALLTQLAYAPPDLMLLDLHMPVLHGLDALKRMRSVPAWRGVPVLFLTASGQMDDMVQARDLGARGYLVKPIRHADLVAKVTRVLDDPDLIWLDDMTERRAC
jgi:two-component system, chemotaxis family, chemotaxis protein CheY